MSISPGLGELGLPLAFSLSFHSRCSFCFLQNLAIGAGAVGSLQLTYISKVRAGGRGCPVPSPYPAVLPGEVRSCPVPIPAACLGGVGGRGTALR